MKLYLILFLFFALSCSSGKNATALSQNTVSYIEYDPNPDETVARFRLLSSKDQGDAMLLEAEVLEQYKTGFSAKAVFTPGDTIHLLSKSKPPGLSFICVFEKDYNSRSSGFRLIRFLK